MSSVNSILEPVLAIYAGGMIRRSEALQEARPIVLVDPEAVAECVDETLTERIKKNATRHGRNVTNGDARQMSFFGNRLKQAYAIDLDEKVIKPTSDLRRNEFLQALEVRRQKRDELNQQIDAMDEAYEALEPIWDEFPEATYGEVERIYLMRSKAAAEEEDATTW